MARRKTVKHREIELTVAVLDAMFAAFNRHDATAVVAMMTEDCVFEAAVGAEVFGAAMSAGTRCGPRSSKPGKRCPMSAGMMCGTSPAAIGRSRNGRSGGHVPTAHASKRKVATCSRRSTGKSPRSRRSARTGRLCRRNLRALFRRSES